MNNDLVPKSRSEWLPPVLGAVGGMFYALVDEELLRRMFAVKTPAFIVYAHDLVDFFLPVLFGLLVGVALNIMRRQVLLNHKLSIQNTKLQRDLLVNTLTSLFLHEIRNPIHNIAAALEDSRVNLPPDINEMLDRNLERLEHTTTQYRKWGSFFDQIDPREKTDFRHWLKEFIENKVRSRFREVNIDYIQDVDPVYVNMHPVLLDQAFTTLFSNACEALAEESKERKLQLVARLHARNYRQIEIKLINRGRGFSEEVLKRQGQAPVKSKSGMGIGLTLLRKVLEHVDGELILSNFVDHAEALLLIPGEAA